MKGIEVETNEGGVTKYVGGCRIIVIPAGYVGGAFWGGFFVALSGSRIGATGTFFWGNESIPLALLCVRLLLQCKQLSLFQCRGLTCLFVSPIL